MDTHAQTTGTLADVLRHGSSQFHLQLRQVLSSPDYVVTDRMSQQQRRENAYNHLKYLVQETGSTRDVATDLPKLFAVFDWSAVLATDLIPLISGHYNLASGSLATLTDSGSAAPYLEDLDDASAIGVMLLTEFGCGSNIQFMQTRATYDPAAQEFVIHTPTPRARKFMPSVGIPVSRVCVVGARYIDADGVDQGVHLFAARLRGADGTPAPGVKITQLDHQPLVIMDNSVIEFEELRVKRSAWLSNGLATIDDQGVLTWRDDDSRKRGFASAISQLTVGRLALSSCLNAAARASLYIALRYASQRTVPLTPTQTPLMLDLPHVRETLLTDLAGTLARTIYGNAIKTRLATSDLTDRDTVVSVMLAKHFIQLHALATVTDARLKLAAQGMFSANRVANYLGVCHAAITGEGDCYVLGSVAGRVLARHLADKPAPESGLHDPADPGDRMGLFNARTLTIVHEAQQYLGTPDLTERLAVIPQALELAEAYCAEEALQLLHRYADRPEIAAVRDVFALHYLDQHVAWYLIRGLLDAAGATVVKQELRRAIDTLAGHLPAILGALELDDEVLGAPALAEDVPNAWEARCAPVDH
ncbi:acyl-CoA dehydrogenase family protein [Nocardia acidivorans]|uniref:acyl-CoA dehydrogenase family protein n=1 Tax=Nocardia acidivorans TaxID=404580 RepID=UPI000AD7184D|nr:hypothetical protein [Nocardia acidivorans]